MTGTLFLERFLELVQKQPPGQKLFAIAADGTYAQKKALLESVKRTCNIYLNELREYQLDPNVPWRATVVHSPGVMVYPPLLLQLEDDPARTLDIVTRMYLRLQDARAKHRRARGAREDIGWSTSDTGAIMADVCHSCMRRLGSHDRFRQGASAEQLRALREYEEHLARAPNLGPADDELSVMKFAARICKRQGEAGGNWGEAVDGVQCRLRVERMTWRQGETPVLYVDVRNAAGESRWFHPDNFALLASPVSAGGEVTTDLLSLDKLYWRMRAGKGANGAGEVLRPGRTREGCLVLLDEQWGKQEDDLTVGGMPPPKPLQMGVGRHVVQVCTLVHKADAEGKPLRRDVLVYSCTNTIELEVTPSADQTGWGKASNGLAIRLIVPRKEGETLPRLTFERFEAVLEVKNVSDRVIKLAEQNTSSGRETELHDWAIGLVIDAHSANDDAGRFFRADDQDGYWSRIGSMPSARQVKPGEVARLRIKLGRLVNYNGQNLLSLRGRYRLRPVLEVRDDKYRLWHG
jgi:hypothetical protein